MSSNRATVVKYFKDYSTVVKPDDVKSRKLRCLCGIVRSQDLRKGFSNIMRHVSQRHPDRAELIASGKDNSRSLFVSKTGQKLFSWMEMVIQGNQPFDFVESKIFRKYIGVETILTDTLMKYIELLVERVEKPIADRISNSLEIVIDGWQDGFTHYIRLFACYVD